jgi:hypothetical protein
MEIAIAVIAVILTLIGIAGCIYPGIPGVPLPYIGMWLIHWKLYQFSTTTLIVYGILTAVIVLLGYMIPVWSARIFGATKTGMRWSIYGMIIGIFLSPIGMMTGLIIGAIAGDLSEGRSPREALKGGLGTYLGALAGIVVNLLLAVIMSCIVWYGIYKGFSVTG